MLLDTEDGIHEFIYLRKTICRDVHPSVVDVIQPWMKKAHVCNFRVVDSVCWWL